MQYARLPSDLCVAHYDDLPPYLVLFHSWQVKNSIVSYIIVGVDENTRTTRDEKESILKRVMAKVGVLVDFMG